MSSPILIRELPRAPSPARLFERFLAQPFPFLLESGRGYGRIGHYSFLGGDPFLVVKSSGRRVEVIGGQGKRTFTAGPFDVIDDLLGRYAVPKGDYPVPFIGGAVGYLGYDLGRLIERLPDRPQDDLKLPESVLCWYDSLIAYDHVTRKAYAISTGLPERTAAKRARRAKERMLGLLAAIGGPPQPEARGPAPAASSAKLEATFTKGGYIAAIREAKRHIIAGDIYQVNLSQRFSAPWRGAPWELYQRLRRINPSPFAAYLQYESFAVVSASPERFLRRAGERLETRPIKGTRPRGATPAEDRRLARELAASAKDRAEHIMIVDLERNDLGRVAEIGSVRVAKMMALERFPTVHHLVSTIEARLPRERTAGEVLRAAFPGGSITGAPKIRSMEIIDELEPVSRGVYTGAIGYLSATGDFDLNIAIRTLVVKDGMAHFHVGGGIVADSDPEAEYQETLDKGKALLAALRGG